MSLEATYHRLPIWAQNLVFNAYAWKIERHRYGSRYRAAVSELTERERWSPDRLRSEQLRRIREVVGVAYQATEFYRSRFDEAGVAPGDIQGLADLARLPVIDKDVVRAHGGAMMTRARPGRGWVHGHTSGTTGTPLGVWYDRATCVMTNAVDRQQKIWGGMAAGDWVGLFLGRLVVPPDQDRPPYWRANRVQKQLWFSSFHLTPDHVPDYLSAIRRHGLRFLEGYPSTMFILARSILDRGETVPMEAVFTSSETLHEVQREAIERAFDCRIFDFYGHAERVVFAMECEEHNGKHLAESFGFVEVVDAKGHAVEDGELGFLTGTSLHNLAMPMIRYRTGDLSRISTEPCPCGRTSRRISNVTTKAEDILVTPEGKMVSPSVLTHPFKPFEGVQKSQIIQRAIDDVLVKLVTVEGFSQEEREQLIGGLQERLGTRTRITVEEVDDIPAERSGKYRWVISQLDHAQRFDWGGRDGE